MNQKLEAKPAMESAGPALDRWIAEHLFDDPKEFGHNLAWSRVNDKWVTANFSTDIAAAWRVVDRMRELGWFFDLNVEPRRIVCLFDRDEEPTYYQAEGESVPLCICLAAKGALEAQG